MILSLRCKICSSHADFPSDWKRWAFHQKDTQPTPAVSSLVLDAEDFEISEQFTCFLVHSNLVPVAFRRKCCQYDIQDRNPPFDGNWRKVLLQRDPPAELRNSSVAGNAARNCILAELLSSLHCFVMFALVRLLSCHCSMFLQTVLSSRSSLFSSRSICDLLLSGLVTHYLCHSLFLPLFIALSCLTHHWCMQHSVRA